MEESDMTSVERLERVYCQEREGEGELAASRRKIPRSRECRSSPQLALRGAYSARSVITPRERGTEIVYLLLLRRHILRSRKAFPSHKV